MDEFLENLCLIFAFDCTFCFIFVRDRIGGFGRERVCMRRVLKLIMPWLMTEFVSHELSLCG